MGLLLTMIAIVLLFSLLGGLLTKANGLDEAGEQRDQLGIGGIATIFAALAGVLVVTSEYRFGTIRPTFVFTPRRWRVVGAKLVASTAAGLALAAVAIGLTWGIGAAILSGRGISLELDAGDVLLIVLGGFAAAALWGAIGAGLGSILHNQVASVIALLVWVFVLENVLFGFVPSVGRFGPGHAGDALSGMTGDHLLPAAAGGGMLVAWAAALGAVGLVLTARRDVELEPANRQLRQRAGDRRPLLEYRGELGITPDQQAVAASAREQLLVAADLDHTSMVEDDDLVGVADRREAVGDRNRRPPGGEPVERLLDEPFRLRVE